MKTFYRAHYPTSGGNKIYPDDKIARKMQVVALCLIRNEDIFLERVLTNIFDFCDQIIIADHKSSDRSAEIAQRWASHCSKIRYYPLRSPWESHSLIEDYANTPTWIFAVDGDEIYDPEGLMRFKKQLAAGDFDRYWHIYGNVLHCDDIDFENEKALGYMTPPCRSMTKLYNFNAILEWAGPCSERLHGGRVAFKPDFTGDHKYKMFEQVSWERSDFRCLHVVFLKRSSLQNGKTYARLTPSEKYRFTLLQKLNYYLLRSVGREPVSRYKLKHYRQGPRGEYDIAPFVKKALFVS